MYMHSQLEQFYWTHAVDYKYSSTYTKLRY